MKVHFLIGLILLLALLNIQLTTSQQQYHLVKVHTSLRFSEKSCGVVVHEIIQYIFEEGDVRRVMRPLSHKYMYPGGQLTDLKVTSSDVHIKSFRILYNYSSTAVPEHGMTNIVMDFDHLPDRRHIVSFDLRYHISQGALMADASKPESTITWSYPWNHEIDEVYLSVHLPSDTHVVTTFPKGDVFVAPELAVAMKRHIKAEDHYYAQVTVSNDGKFTNWKVCEPRSVAMKKAVSELTVDTEKCVVKVIEKIDYKFRSNVTHAYRPIPHQLAKGTKITNLDVESQTPGVTIKKKSTKLSKYHHGTFIGWEFDGLHTGYKDVTFALTYLIEGALRTKGPHTELHWSFNFSRPIGEVKTIFHVPEVQPVDDIKAYPASDSKVESGRIEFTKKDIKAHKAYDINICMPSKVGKWDKCNAVASKNHVARKVFGAVVVLAVLLMLFGGSVWLALKRKPEFIFRNRFTTKYLLRDDYANVPDYQTTSA